VKTNLKNNLKMLSIGRALGGSISARYLLSPNQQMTTQERREGEREREREEG